MAGWTAGYNFNIGGQKFSTVNWNEIEFARNSRYAENQGGETGVNGGLSLFWHPVKNIKLVSHTVIRTTS
ncbi:putative exported protein [Vibrio variabilis]|uniref:Exported protein n=1 Tax=Vibrio variabilis TaxID=990271 RepID=A0ABQ0JMU9_9VIBR|nr:putative exported protein [Vibrio variabilis]